MGTTTSRKKNHAKYGVFCVAILMMGAIGINSSLATINAHFPDASQTMITNIMAFVTIGCIIATLVTGFLATKISKKILAIIGIILFLIGGLLPLAMNDLNSILACRIVFGVGVGMCQSMCASLIAENYEGKERAKAMGQVFCAQMVGCIIMTIIGSYLATISWNGAFMVHAIGFISLVAAIVLIPNIKPGTQTHAEADAPAAAAGEKIHITAECVGWWIMMMLFFIPGQVFSNCISYLMEELGMGNSVVAGFSLTGMCIGGIFMGLVFGACDKKLKNMTPGMGFLLRFIGYVMIAFCFKNVGVAVAGSIVCGMGVTMCLSTLNDKASNSVNATTMAVALSITACLQNIGQTVSAYITNPLGFALAEATGLTPNQGTYTLAAIWFLVMGVIFVAWGAINNNRKAGQYYRVNKDAE